MLIYHILTIAHESCIVYEPTSPTYEFTWGGVGWGGGAQHVPRETVKKHYWVV